MYSVAGSILRQFRRMTRKRKPANSFVLLHRLLGLHWEEVDGCITLTDVSADSELYKSLDCFGRGKRATKTRLAIKCVQTNKSGVGRGLSRITYLEGDH